MELGGALFWLGFGQGSALGLGLDLDWGLARVWIACDFAVGWRERSEER